MKFVSFIIPVRPGVYPQKAIDHICRLDYPLDRIEILLAEGNRPSLQRNIAVEQAAGTHIYFLDDDSFISPDSLTIGLEYLENHDTAAVGGPAITHDEGSFLEQCFGEVLASPCGTFTTHTRNDPVGEPRRVRGEELILCNLIMKKSVFSGASGLDVRLYPNEENDLLKRLRQDDHTFYYLPEMIVHRTRQRSVMGFAKQIFSYGFGRAKHVHRYFSIADLPFLVPTLFIFYLSLVPFVHSAWFKIPLVLYFGLVAAGSLRIAIRKKPIVGLTALPMFVLVHLSYGLGVLWGLLSNWRYEKAPVLPIKVHRIDPHLYYQDEVQYANT